jgi:hypothetical protein
VLIVVPFPSNEESGVSFSHCFALFDSGKRVCEPATAPAAPTCDNTHTPRQRRTENKKQTNTKKNKTTQLYQQRSTKHPLGHKYHNNISVSNNMLDRLILLVLAVDVALSAAFTPIPNLRNLQLSQTRISMVTIAEPRPITETEKRQDTDRRSKEGKGDKGFTPPGRGDVDDPLEWFIDDDEISRDDDEPFHILLLGETFLKSDRVTVEYVASCCVYVLGMPLSDAEEQARHAKSQGFSCLGTWSHEECLKLGGQLRQRDIVCRVVPFCEGGDRSWQARDANSGDEVIEVSGSGSE